MITQKKYLNLTALLMAIITSVLFLPCLSHADLTVIEKHDFGEVIVGNSSSATLTISSSDSDVRINTLTFENNCGFSISTEVSLPISVPPSVDFNIDYSPSEEGPCTSKLIISYTSTTIMRGIATVELTGTGVTTTQQITIDGILSFFDTCTADGSLEGYVPDKSDNKRSAGKITKGHGSDKLAENRLNALRNMIETAGDLIDSGKIDEACGQLEAVYKKMDGLNPPGDSIDFVKGSAVSDLAPMIQELMGTLECN